MTDLAKDMATFNVILALGTSLFFIIKSDKPSLAVSSWHRQLPYLMACILVTAIFLESGEALLSMFFK